MKLGRLLINPRGGYGIEAGAICIEWCPPFRWRNWLKFSTWAYSETFNSEYYGPLRVLHGTINHGEYTDSKAILLLKPRSIQPCRNGTCVPRCKAWEALVREVGREKAEDDHKCVGGSIYVSGCPDCMNVALRVMHANRVNVKVR